MEGRCLLRLVSRGWPAPDSGSFELLGRRVPRYARVDKGSEERGEMTTIGRLPFYLPHQTLLCASKSNVKALVYEDGRIAVLHKPSVSKPAPALAPEPVSGRVPQEFFAHGRTPREFIRFQWRLVPMGEGSRPLEQEQWIEPGPPQTVITRQVWDGFVVEHSSFPAEPEQLGWFTRVRVRNEGQGRRTLRLASHVDCDGELEAREGCLFDTGGRAIVQALPAQNVSHDAGRNTVAGHEGILTYVDLSPTSDGPLDTVAVRGTPPRWSWRHPYADLPLAYSLRCEPGGEYVLGIGAVEPNDYDAGSLQVDVDGEVALTRLPLGGPDEPALALLRVWDLDGDGVIRVTLRRRHREAKPPLLGGGGATAALLCLFRPEEAPDNPELLLEAETRRTAVASVECGSAADAPFDTGYLVHEVELGPGEEGVFWLRLAAEDADRQVSPEVVREDSARALNTRWAAGLDVDVPDQRTRESFDLLRAQLFMLLEPAADGMRVLKGPTHYYGSNPYDTLRASRALDVCGFREEAEAILRRQLKRVRPDDVFEMWEREVPPERVEMWIVQGLAPLAIWQHYVLWRDRAWLEEAAPTLVRAAWATRRARAGHAAELGTAQSPVSGMVPPGFGDGGLPNNAHTYAQNFGPLTGVWVALQVARELGSPDASWLETEYADFKEAMLRSREATAMIVDGYRVPPSFPTASTPEDAGSWQWGNVMAVHPLRQVPVDDELALSLLRFLQARKERGLHRNLGYGKGLFQYLSCDVGHWHLRLGEYDEAWAVFEAMLDNAGPTGGWFEEIESEPPLGYGDMPDAWATSEALHLLRELLLWEDDDAAWLATGVPAEWAQPGGRVAVRRAPTRWGRCGYAITWTEAGASVDLSLPETPVPVPIRLRVRPPAGRVCASARLDGDLLPDVDGQTGMLYLPPKLAGRHGAEVSWG